MLDASGNGVYGAGDLTYIFGKAGDVFVTGDGNSDSKTEIGVVRNSNTWLLDASGNGAYGAEFFAFLIRFFGFFQRFAGILHTHLLLFRASRDDYLR